jgi:carboxypeptidase C (cathepsin A)
MKAIKRHSVRAKAETAWRRGLAMMLALALAGALMVLPGSAQAQRPERSGPPPAARHQPGEGAAAKPQASAPALPQDAVTQHEATLDGKKFSYTARAGSIALTNSEGAKQAEIFYVAYTRDGENKATRPITFALNGGPGASAAYLDMGALGPRILDFGNGRSLPRQRATLIQNPDSWLDLTDLVFIDPVGTGYSIPTVGGEQAQKEFYGVDQDLQALGAVIRRLLDKLDRFGAPVYLVGESYGGFRAARLPLTLANDEGIAVSGTIMISPVLDFSLMGGDDLNPLPWALELPSMAAVNLEREGTLTPQALKPAERFALGDYLSSLVAPIGKTTAASPIDAKIASLIGIPESIVARWSGRVPTGIFIKAIHHNEGEIVSRYDGSVAGPDADPSAYVARRGDPILEGLTAPLTSGFIAYLRDELRFKTDRRYVLLSGDVSRHWQWGNRGPAGAVDAADDLARAMALNPALKVMIAHGMTDLVTPYMTSRYAVDHLPATIARERIMLALYPGGHMMYLRPGSRAALHADAKRLFTRAE